MNPPTLDELCALVSSMLPDEWRGEVSVTTRPEQIVFSATDEAGETHRFDLRPLRPGAPSLVPGERLAYAYVASGGSNPDEALLSRYRELLSAVAAREGELLPWFNEVPASNVSNGDDSQAPIHPDSPEWIAFETGLKPAIRVVLPDAAALAPLAREARARGWGFYSPERPLRFSDYTQRVGYIARSDAGARALADAEAPEGADGERVALGGAVPNALVGRLLGYPPCCTEAFARRIELGVTLCPDGSLAHEDYAAAQWAARDVSRPLATLNNLLSDRGSPRLVTFFPCRYDCAAARSYAQSLLDALAQRSPDQARRWGELLVGRHGIDRAGRRLRPGEQGDDPLWLHFEGL